MAFMKIGQCQENKPNIKIYLAAFITCCKYFDIHRVATHPGKREIPGNFVLHVPGREMSLKIKKMVKIWDLPWKSLLKA